MVTTPLSTVSTWSRVMFSVDPLDESAASGRMPLQADSTSERLGAVVRYSPSVSSMKSTSAEVGRGVCVSSAGASVVPATEAPSQGMRKQTRPSRVRGTMSAVLEPQKRAGSVMCTPLLGVISVGVSTLPVACLHSDGG